MKLAIILGTRPEIIKMAPIIRECEKRKMDYFVLHTGQHYSKELDEQIFLDLELPKPKYNLGVGSQPYRKQVGIMTREIEKIFEKELPNLVLVQGDTISVLAGALAAKKLNIKVGHHEAGLRSHDTSMLEEVNRVIVDHISDFLFTPTPDALKNLHQEGKEPSRIFFTGNTIVDALNQNIEIARNKSKILEKLGLRSKSYILVTAHRAENVDKPEKLKDIINGLSLIYKEFAIPLVFPIHPRTLARMKENNIESPKGLFLLEPVGFLDFLILEQNAKLVITDSGGVQEECFVLKVPCVTIRENTERPETIEYGMNILAGTNPDKMLLAAKEMFSKSINPGSNGWENPFGDGKAAERILDILMEKTK
ncbi:UDP-N-acetylglucosamine 2-epimerase (non-hydrolyzing) [Candidatus Pacearchaeota archaeon]|nr:UDP-N-acetylglucosamine 2-epimerase (non-hydrolyzing) [Candidatus Pacearchaeota archaeon]